MRAALVIGLGLWGLGCGGDTETPAGALDAATLPDVLDVASDVGETSADLPGDLAAPGDVAEPEDVEPTDEGPAPDLPDTATPEDVEDAADGGDEDIGDAADAGGEDTPDVQDTEAPADCLPLAPPGLGEIALVDGEQPQSQRAPAVAIDDSGAGFVAWAAGSAAANDIWGRALGADGSLTGDRVEISDGTGDHGEPDVVALPDGRFVVAWILVEGTSVSYEARFIGAGGEPKGDVLPLSTVALADCSLCSETGPGLAPAGDGFAAVYAGTATTPGSEVLVRLFDAAGAPLGAAEPLVGVLDPGIVHDIAGANVATAVRPDGGFVAAWDERPPKKGVTRAVGRRFDGDGAWQGLFEGFAPAPDEPTFQGIPAVVALPGDRFVIGWKTMPDPFALYPPDVHLRRLDDLGHLDGPAHLLGHDDEQGAPEAMALAALPDQQVLAIWRAAVGETGSIWLRRYDASADLLECDTHNLADDTVDAETILLRGKPDAASTPEGGVRVVWSDLGRIKTRLVTTD